MAVQLFAPPTKVQGSFPGATVTVFTAGTTILATIYNDNAGTAKPNPFTADHNNGEWFFYAPGGTYDVQLSGGGIPQPFTIGALGTTVGVSSLFGTGYVSACDYPGADASQKINNAIVALPAAGGIVDCRCLAGAQVIGTTITLNKPIKLLFSQATFTGSVDPMINITSSNCKITCDIPGLCSFVQNLTNGNGIKVAGGVAHTLIEHVMITITTIPTTMQSAENNLFTNDGIYAAGTQSAPVTDLIVQHCTLVNGGNGIWASWTNNSRFLHNLFIMNAPATLSYTAPGFLSALTIAGSYNIADGNDFQLVGNIANFIYLRPPDQFNQTGFPGSNFNVVSNNTCTANPITFEGINGVGAAHNTVIGNVLNFLTTTSITSGIVFQTGGAAPTSDYNSITGNTINMADANFASIGGAGISLHTVNQPGTPGVGLNYNTISANTIRGPQVGIDIANIGSNNDVSNNTIFVTGGTSFAAGIQVAADTVGSIVDTTITGNIISGATGHGIDIIRATRVQVQGNYVVGTTFGHGVFAQIAGTFADSYISGNSFVNNQGAGINLATGTSTAAAIGTNYFFGNVQGDINIQNVGSVLQPSGMGPLRLASLDTGSSAHGVNITNAVTADRSWTIPDASDTFVGRNTTDTLANKTLTNPFIDNLTVTHGVHYDAAGWKATRFFTTGGIPPSTSANFVATLPGVAFPDTNYTVLVTMVDGGTGTSVLQIAAVLALTTTSVTVRVTNPDTVNNRSGTIHVLAMHDPY
jgi:hypothetical protein